MIEFPVTPLTIQSGDFIVGFSGPNPAGLYPAVLDTTPPLAQRSYLGTDGATLRLIEGNAGNLGIRARID